MHYGILNILNVFTFINVEYKDEADDSFSIFMFERNHFTNCTSVVLCVI